MSSILKYLEERIFFPMRYESVSEKIAPYLEGCKKVLDVGAADGAMAKYIQKKLDIDFIGIDTHIQPKSYIPIKKYDGETIPFQDESFDAVMLIDVLHHTTDAEHTLSECRRVTKKYIVIKDHYWVHRWEYHYMRYGDAAGNKPFGIDVPCNFFNIERWRDTIKKMNFKIVKYEGYRLFIDPTKHIILKLKK